MATLSFSIPDEVSEAFHRAFMDKDQNELIVEFMRKAVAEAEQQSRRQEAFQLLTERRSLRPKLSFEEIVEARTEVRR
jgi:hypothetical protein